MVAEGFIVQLILVVEQLVERRDERHPFDVDRIGTGCFGQQRMDARVFLHEQFIGKRQAAVAQVLEQGIDPIDVCTPGIDLHENVGRDKGLKRRFVSRLPEVQYRLHKADDAVGTLHMALFAQKMG